MLKRPPAKSEVESFLKRLLNEIAKVPVDRITPDSAIDGDLRMESVVFVEIQVALEEEYDIQLDPIEVVERNQFSSIVEYVHALANGG
jgi:acyl carrier protein